MTRVYHEFQSAKSDGGDATLVRPSDWNADHVIDGEARSFSGARARLSGGDQNVDDGTWTLITLASEDYDTGGFHSTSSNTGRMTAHATGYFKAHAIAGWRVNTSGERLIAIYKNGVIYSQYAAITVSGATLDGDGPAISDIIPVVANDYIELWVYQSSGGTRSVSSARLSVEFVAEANVGAVEQEMYYEEITSGVNVTATVEASSDVIIAGSSVTYDGSPVVIEFFSGEMRPRSDSSGAWIAAYLFVDGSSIGEIALHRIGTASGNIEKPIIGRRRFSPSAGAHTISIRGLVSGGTGFVGAGTGGAGTAPPAFLRITRANAVIESLVWADFTPVIKAGSTTLTWTGTARYIQIGKLTHYHLRVTLTSGGTGVISISSLPAPLQHVDGASGAAVVGHGIYAEQGVAYYSVNVRPATATDWRLVKYNDFADLSLTVGASDGDVIGIEGFVEIA